MVDSRNEETPAYVGLETQEGQWCDSVQVWKSERQGNGGQEKMGGSAPAERTHPPSASLL